MNGYVQYGPAVLEEAAEGENEEQDTKMETFQCSKVKQYVPVVMLCRYTSSTNDLYLFTTPGCRNSLCIIFNKSSNSFIYITQKWYTEGIHRMRLNQFHVTMHITTKAYNQFRNKVGLKQQREGIK